MDCHSPQGTVSAASERERHVQPLSLSRGYERCGYTAMIDMLMRCAGVRCVWSMRCVDRVSVYAACDLFCACSMRVCSACLAVADCDSAMCAAMSAVSVALRAASS